MHDISFLKKSLYSALVFFGTIMVLSIGYAAWNNSMGKVSIGNTLSASGWNALVDNISDLDDRWARSGGNVVFTGGNVGIGTTSPTYAFVNANRITQTSGNVPGLLLSDTQTGAHEWGIFSGSPSAGIFKIRDNTTASDKLIIDTSGNV